MIYQDEDITLSNLLFDSYCIFSTGTDVAKNLSTVALVSDFLYSQVKAQERSLAKAKSLGPSLCLRLYFS